jgi:hypothetical protein
MRSTSDGRKQIAATDLLAGDRAALPIASYRFAGGFDIGHGKTPTWPPDRPCRDLRLKIARPRDTDLMSSIPIHDPS